MNTSDQWNELANQLHTYNSAMDYATADRDRTTLYWAMAVIASPIMLVILSVLFFA